MNVINLRIFDKHIEIHCNENDLAEIVVKCFSSFQTSEAKPDISISIGRRGTGDLYIGMPETCLLASDLAELIFFLEKEITVRLQKMRSELYFIHAAALKLKDKACLLVAESGGGKSTTTWAMLHHGFEYYSDELAPIDMETMQIVPYPHALCLKKDPPAPYSLPTETLRTTVTLHVPTSQIPSNVCEERLPISAIFFVKYTPKLFEPMLRPVASADAAARIYTNALNQLAHSNHGLTAAAQIATHCQCYELLTADLVKTAELMKQTVTNLDWLADDVHMSAIQVSN